MTEHEAFLLCRFPGESTLRRYDFTAADFRRGSLIFGDATVTPWPGCSGIHKMPVADCSTDYNDYCSRVGAIIRHLKKEGGKTVVARQLCGRFLSFKPENMAAEYFDAFPDVFCFLFYHPFTGWWMGASPELLLQSDCFNTVYTRALAGTRNILQQGEWDKKNIEEHAFVTEDIVNRVKSVTPDSISVELSRRNLRYGKIEHLCTDITITSSEKIDPMAIIGAIHPTPAVGGYPREASLRSIEQYESYPRNCYGGHIAVKTSNGIIAYVILRCVHFDTGKWAVYTGSGITSSSVPHDEWIETEEKAAPLISLLSKYSCNE